MLKINKKNLLKTFPTTISRSSCRLLCRQIWSSGKNRLIGYTQKMVDIKNGQRKKCWGEGGWDVALKVWRKMTWLFIWMSNTILTQKNLLQFLAKVSKQRIFQFCLIFSGAPFCTQCFGRVYELWSTLRQQEAVQGFGSHPMWYESTVILSV